MKTQRRNLIERLRELLPLDLPRAVPVYLVARYELPDNFHRGVCADYRAWTSKVLDLWLAEHLERMGTWQGRGFAVVIHETALLYGPDEELLRVLLHEAAHRFQQPESILHRPLEDWPAEIHFMAQPPAAVDVEQIENELPPALPWDRHEWEFIRSALHVRHRAAVNGFDVPAEQLIIAGPQYGLSHVDHYLDLLAAEVDACAEQPLAEVMRTAPPAPFVELFERDTAPSLHRGGRAGSSVPARAAAVDLCSPSIRGGRAGLSSCPVAAVAVDAQPRGAGR